MTTGAFNDPSGDGNPLGQRLVVLDRKSTRLNSSHSQISYAVFCLKKKKKKVYQDNARLPTIQFIQEVSGYAASYARRTLLSVVQRRNMQISISPDSPS